MKYGTWKTAAAAPEVVNRLIAGGFAPLAALVLASRGLSTPESAKAYLSTTCPLPDPFLMTDMDKAAQRVALAISRGEKIAVFGDYDVDGVTATCLLTDYLRSQGANCVYYIPGRLEEGYGLNGLAIRQLHESGVRLIVTVDCGITAVQEAKLCRELGIDLVITDHHECKEQLPDAVAVVDPHRKDGGYPHKTLSGVGVAFKLAAALHGNQQDILQRYADMVCLGTVADVMPLLGENRVFVARGLESLRTTHRPGLKSLMDESGCDSASVSTCTIGYILAPRINAAGRMGQIDWAVRLFLTQNPQEGAEAAQLLCQLNRERQNVETKIYRQAVAMLPPEKTPEAIVLSSPDWHQGVVGIVASRMAEEYRCPTFLICLDGDKGKASSRSYGGFNLFSSLTTLSPLLESYGGHELAAGFTIARQRIDDFREAVCRLAGSFYQNSSLKTALEIDCSISPELLTIPNVESLSALEPCGSGCPRPVFLLERLLIERLTPVGNGRHLRLRLRQGRHIINAICFSATAQSLSIAENELVDLACTLQINEFRGTRTIQVNLLDIRPSCTCDCDADPADYRCLRAGVLTPMQAAQMLPTRQVLGDIWRYLSSCGGTCLTGPECLCRKIVRQSGRPLALSQMLVCLDIFQEAGLLEKKRQNKYLSITLTPGDRKVDLGQCSTMKLLQQLREDASYGNL